MNPSWTCAVCGRVVWTTLPARSPWAAERRLKKACKADGHTAEPKYLAGIE